MGLLEMSFRGTVIILVVIIVRALAINILPKKTLLALWGVATMRLILPFSLPSIFSVYSVLRNNAVVMDMSGREFTGIVMPFESIKRDSIGFDASANANFGISKWTIIWAVGVFVLALVFGTAYWKCRQDFCRALPVNNDYISTWLSTHPLKRHLSIRQSDRNSTPLAYGVFRPVILMPSRTDWEKGESLQYILEHEYVHIRRFDALVKLLLLLTLCIHWYNPMVWVMYALVNRDIELACDETVVRKFGEKAKSDYARILINMEEIRSGIKPLCNSFSKNSVQERIIAIMKIRKSTRSSRALACCFVIGITVVFATSASAADIRISQNIKEENEVLDDTAMTEAALLKLERNYPDVARWTRECYPDAVWWTYEGYQNMMQQQKAAYEELLGQYIGTTPSEGDIIVTQELIEEQMSEYEGFLDMLKNGVMVSKSIDGNEDIGTTFDPVDIAEGTGTRELKCSILLNNGTEKVFGPYSSPDEMLDAVTPFCEEQVKLGALSQSEADEIINKYAEID
ncbi:M56 family metallopeptidase [Blautia schinkii]|nr:M56 family metallopeptidase [Blautia schinkii]